MAAPVVITLAASGAELRLRRAARYAAAMAAELSAAARLHPVVAEEIEADPRLIEAPYIAETLVSLADDAADEGRRL